jgi:hypothetical protein
MQTAPQTSAPSQAQSAPGVSVANPGGIQLLANWASPTYLVPGQNLTVNQDVQANHDVTLQLRFDLLNGQGQQVAEAVLDDQPVSKEGIASFSTSLTVPKTLAPGQYTVQTSIYSPGGASMWQASDSTSDVVIEAPTPTPTPVVVATPIPADDDASADN